MDKTERRYYMVERVPAKYEDAQTIHDGVKRWYVHMKGFPYIPVWGSIGTKQHAEKICRQYNPDGRVHYS